MNLLKQYKTVLYVIAAVALVLAVSYFSYNYGVNSERMAWQKTEIQNAQAMNSALATKFADFATKQSAANSLMEKIAAEQRVAASAANSLKKELKNVVKNDVSDCPAFDPDGLRLYRRALNYPD